MTPDEMGRVSTASIDKKLSSRRLKNIYTALFARPIVIKTINSINFRLS
jgi:hypothetical protein